MIESGTRMLADIVLILYHVKNGFWGAGGGITKKCTSIIRELEL